MRFLEVELDNIFAYEGLSKVDLSGSGGDRPIVLIWGRNGMGKTSFLNALKLLFSGIEDEEDRTVGFPPRPLPPRQYVVGDGAGWSGVINRRAAERAVRTKTDVCARVKATWESDGVRVSGERQWTLAQTGVYQETLVVYDGEVRLTGDPAHDRLADFLPREFIPFFLFDGEAIKSLAETAERKQIDFDRLLRITFVGDVAEELEKLAAERRKRGMVGELRRQYDAAQQALDRAIATQADARDILRENDELLAYDTVELRRLQVRRENLGSGASEAQRAALDDQRKRLRLELSEQIGTIANEVSASAPMLANLRLVDAALKAIDARLAAAGAAEAILLGRIKQDLPGWLAGAEVELSVHDIETLARNLGERLDEMLDPADGAGLFAGLDLGTAERVRNALVRWNEAGPVVREVQAAQLASAHRINRELQQVQEALLQIEVGSQSNLEQFRQVMRDMAELEDRIGQHNQKKGQQTARLGEAQAEEAAARATLKRLEGSRERASKDAAEARFINQVVLTLNELREAFRRATREELEALINDRFQRIIDHPLVDKIEIDDTYTLTFLDDGGRKVGRASLSAGLKQLAATALLWAMKDSAKSSMPVVIDTPLGRIDRENQDHMLHNYYPKLSHQVIVLPTNAEIDGRKLAILEPHVALHYKIVNETGQSARIELGALVEPA